MNSPKRVETGKVQIGDDWPGVFIRGDHALHDARTLRAFLDGADHLINRAVLSGLADALASAEARNGIDPVMLCRRDPAVILAAAMELPEVKALVEAVDRYRQTAEAVGGCGDGGCVIHRPGGQHTNGGCRCTYRRDDTRQREVTKLLLVAQGIVKALAALNPDVKKDN